MIQGVRLTRVILVWTLCISCISWAAKTQNKKSSIYNMSKTTEGAKENLFVCKYTWILVCCWWCSISIVGCQMWGPNSGFDQSLRRQELHEFAKCICPNCKMYLSYIALKAKCICPNCKMHLSKLQNVFV